MSNPVKVYILADNVEEFKRAISIALEEDPTFLKHSPTWYKGCDLIDAKYHEHVEFLDYRSASKAIKEAGYEINLL